MAKLSSLLSCSGMAAQQPLVKFWTDQLLGKPPLLLLPTDKPRTSNASSLFQVSRTQRRVTQLWNLACILHSQKVKLEEARCWIHTIAGASLNSSRADCQTSSYWAGCFSKRVSGHCCQQKLQVVVGCSGSLPSAVGAVQ